jgi:hypothetical protein
LNKAEKNYPPHKREFLALKWSICDKFKDYLYGQRFTVLTDNNPVTYVLTTAKLDATGHRWLTALSTFNFDIKYRPGKNNADADALSHLPAVHDSEGCTITSESVQAICDSMIPKSYVESLAVSPEIVEEDLAATKNSNQSESTLSTHSKFFTIRVGLHGFPHVRETQRRIPAYFGHHGSLH